MNKLYPHKENVFSCGVFPKRRLQIVAISVKRHKKQYSEMTFMFFNTTYCPGRDCFVLSNIFFRGPSLQNPVKIDRNAPKTDKLDHSSQGANILKR